MKRATFFAQESNGELKFSFKKDLEDFLSQNKNKKFTVTIQRETGVRTGTQNNSIHKYFELVAQELNDAGYSVNLVLKPYTSEINWNTDLVKELIWRPIQKMVVGKTSTTELDKVSDISEIYEHINRFLSEKFFIHIPFPSNETH